MQLKMAVWVVGCVLCVHHICVLCGVKSVNFPFQAFLLPPSDVSATQKVVKVYQKWILQEKPVFMEEPDKKEDSQDAVVPVEDSSVQTDGKHVWYPCSLLCPLQ